MNTAGQPCAACGTTERETFMSAALGFGWYCVPCYDRRPTPRGA